MVLSLILAICPYQAQAQPEAPTLTPCVEGAETVLNIGDRTTGCQITDPVETDTFHFAGAAGQSLRVIILSGEGLPGFNPRVEIFHPNGDAVRSVVASRDLILALTGDYRLVVSDLLFDATGDYTLALEGFPDISTVPVIPSTLPPGSPDGSISVSDAIDFVTDHDFFAFRGTAGQSLRVIILSGEGLPGFNPRVEIFDPNGDAVRSVVASGDLILALTGVYRLVVSDLLFDATGNYTLALETIPDVSIVPVIPYAPPSPSVSGTIDAMADHDFFAFKGLAGTTVRFITAGDGLPGFNPRVEIFDPNGDSVRSVVGATDLPLALTGDYLIAVSDLLFDATGDYDLSLVCLAGACPTQVPTTPPITQVDPIGVVPDVFTTNGGTFALSVTPRDINGNAITAGVTPGNFAFRDVQATLVAAPMTVTPATATEVTGIDIREPIPGESVSLVLDFDSSGSMAENDPGRSRVEAGKRVLTFLTPADQVAIMDFGAGVTEGLQASRLLQDFTSDTALLETAIDSVTAEGDTDLFDSLLDALGLLEAQGGANRAVMVLTDGEDTSSVSTPAEVISRATMLNQTPICTIGLGEGVGIPPLQTIAGETGCTFAAANDAAALDAIFQLITRGLLNGRVVVMGAGRFDTPLQLELYRISGILTTLIGDISVDTPFEFAVEVAPAGNALSVMRKSFQRPDVPYTAAQERR
jgi:Mg-chelatase subunit ChlD